MEGEKINNSKTMERHASETQHGRWMSEEYEPGLISAVIPLYNKERHIARAIQSVLGQTYGDFELIVVNDGSTDGSAELVKTFTDPRIRLVHREHINSWGGHAARNLGIAESRAGLIAFLDADDEWLPEHLATIKRLSEKYQECGAYATAYKSVIKSGIIITNPCYGIPEPPWEGVIPNYFQSRMGSYVIHTSSTAVKKDVFIRVGFFPEGERRAGDDDMWIRIALRYDIAFSNYFGLIYHCDADNRISYDKTLPFRLRLFDTLAMAAKSDDFKAGIVKNDVTELRNSFIINRVYEYLTTGRLDVKQAKFWLRETKSTRIFSKNWKRTDTITNIPGLIIIMSLKSLLFGILRRFGVRRPHFLRRKKNAF